MNQQSAMPVNAETCVWHGAMRSIQNHVCKVFDVSYLEMMSTRRDQKCTQPRHLAIWLCRKMTMASFPQIGRAFGNRDHTTIMHAIKVVDARIKHEVKFSAEVQSILKALNNGQKK